MNYFAIMQELECAEQVIKDGCDSFLGEIFQFGVETDDLLQVALYIFSNKEHERCRFKVICVNKGIQQSRGESALRKASKLSENAQFPEHTLGEFEVGGVNFYSLYGYLLVCFQVDS